MSEAINYIYPLPIKTVQDVETFFTFLLYAEDLNFHPDDSFEGYINMDDGERTYTDTAAANRNERMGECFDVCEAADVDIYGVGIELFNKRIEATETTITNHSKVLLELVEQLKITTT